MPVLELYVLIRVGQWLGAWPTVGLVFLTAAVGITLLRQQGFSTLRTVQARLEAGELPARQLVEGLVLVVGGALFLAPGFITDIFGFACLLPPTRRRMAAFLMARGVWLVQAGVRQGAGPDVRTGPFQPEPFRPERQGHIIEGEFERDDDPRP
ncbi:MAG: FxsA family protein [Gammaproteobacteria bacterium]|nr:FxsA family protein [Gammaproteobacteria bacterium]